MDVCEVEYKKLDISNERGENMKLTYEITIGTLDTLRIAAEIYGVRVKCMKGEGIYSEKRIENITANRKRILFIMDYLVKMTVFPDELMYVMDEILEKSI